MTRAHACEIRLKVKVTLSHGIAEEGVVAGVNTAVISADEELRFSSEELSQVDTSFPGGRRTPAGLQLRPFVADDYRDRLCQRHIQLNNTVQHTSINFKYKSTG